MFEKVTEESSLSRHEHVVHRLQRLPSFPSSAYLDRERRPQEGEEGALGEVLVAGPSLGQSLALLLQFGNFPFGVRRDLEGGDPRRVDRLGLLRGLQCFRDVLGTLQVGHRLLQGADVVPHRPLPPPLESQQRRVDAEQEERSHHDRVEQRPRPPLEDPPVGTGGEARLRRSEPSESGAAGNPRRLVELQAFVLGPLGDAVAAAVVFVVAAAAGGRQGERRPEDPPVDGLSQQGGGCR